MDSLFQAVKLAEKIVELSRRWQYYVMSSLIVGTVETDVCACMGYVGGQGVSRDFLVQMTSEIRVVGREKEAKEAAYVNAGR